MGTSRTGHAQAWTSRGSCYLIREMERLYSWMCWMISSSSRSVMVSKSANVSVWRGVEETGWGHGGAQLPRRGTFWACAWPDRWELGLKQWGRGRGSKGEAGGHQRPPHGGH